MVSVSKASTVTVKMPEQRIREIDAEIASLTNEIRERSEGVENLKNMDTATLSLLGVVAQDALKSYEDKIARRDTLHKNRKVYEEMIKNYETAGPVLRHLSTISGFDGLEEFLPAYVVPATLDADFKALEEQEKRTRARFALLSAVREAFQNAGQKPEDMGSLRFKVNVPEGEDRVPGTIALAIGKPVSERKGTGRGLHKITAASIPSASEFDFVGTDETPTLADLVGKTQGRKDADYASARAIIEAHIPDEHRMSVLFVDGDENKPATFSAPQWLSQHWGLEMERIVSEDDSDDDDEDDGDEIENVTTETNTAE